MKLPPACSTAFLLTMEPVAPGSELVQSGANGSFSTITPEYWSITSTWSSCAMSSAYSDCSAGSAMRS